MGKRRVFLLRQQNLLGESLEHILNHLEDVEVVGTWTLEGEGLPFLAEPPPDIIFVVEQETPPVGPTLQRADALMMLLLERYADTPVIRVMEESNMLHIYISQTVPARLADLVKAIRRLKPEILNGEAYDRNLTP